MISILVKNTKEENNNIEVLLDSIREVSPKESINICDNHSERLIYINHLQNGHFKRHKYANNKTSILFSINNISDMIIRTIDLYPDAKDYWFIANTNWKMIKTLEDINKSENNDVLTLHSNDKEARFEIFKLPNRIVEAIKLMFETIKDERDVGSILNKMTEDDTFLLRFIKDNNVDIVSLFGNYYNEANIKNEYFELIKNEND